MVFLGVKLGRVDRVVLTILRGIGQSLFSISHVASTFEQCGKMGKNSERTSWEMIVSLSLRIPHYQTQKIIPTFYRKRILIIALRMTAFKA